MDQNMQHIGVEEIFSSIVSKDGRLSGVWKGLRLASVYQPIFGISQKRIVGFEALVRGRDIHGNALSPAKIFSLAKTEEDLIFLDRLLRAIHILNFQSYRNAPVWLFLNVEPTVALTSSPPTRFARRESGKEGDSFLPTPRTENGDRFAG